MNALRVWKQSRTQPVFWLAIMVAVIVGCKDASSKNSRPPSNRNAGKVKAPKERVSSYTSQAESVEGPNGTATKRISPNDPSHISGKGPSRFYEPKVVLSSSHEETCLVKVGDTMPDLALQSLTGEAVSLKELRGDGLTVVVFWTTRLVMAHEQFRRLAIEVVLPLRDVGVRVVAINVGDPVEQIELDPTAIDDVACVLDPDGSATATVATDILPRTYLIDSEGHILWFDIGYSRTTRRQLKNAVFYFSREKNADPS